jgi:Lectin C-type domain
MIKSGLHGVCGVAALAGLLCAAPAAHAQVVAFNGHFYGVTNTSGSWLQAETESVNLGGTLATITSQAESNFIINAFLAASPPDARPRWIGLTDVAVEGQFAWVTGEPLTFTNWYPGEPNNSSPDGGEDYVTINWHRSLGLTPTPGAWNDVPQAGTSQANPITDGPYHGIFELPPLAGDFSEDGNVNGADLSTWRTKFGMSTGALHTNGDANSDGDVDGGDFLAWQQQSGRSYFGSAIAVPEPATEGYAVTTIFAAELWLRMRRTAPRSLAPRIKL